MLMMALARGRPSWRAQLGRFYSTGSSSAEDAKSPPEAALPPAQVLDLGQVVAGNFCGALLSYFGADVIKVEPPGRGDPLRSLRMLEDEGTSLWWRCHGRNRRCITANLHTAEGRDIVKRLSERMDVVVENFRPGVMEGWGLGPADLKPELIFTRISGYGQTGPRAEEPGYASVCEAYGGLRHLNGYVDRPPVRPNLSLGDTLAGLHAAFGAVMALLHRQRNAGAKSADGTSAALGQVVDASISESVFNMLESCVAEVAHAGHDRQPSGSTISDVVPSGTFSTKDGRYVIIGGNGDSVYTRLMEAVGRKDMGAANPEYANNALRVRQQHHIMGVLETWCLDHTLEEVMAAMSAARVPSGPILSTADIMEEPQYQERNMFHSAPPPGSSEEVTMPAILPVLSRTPGATRWAGPALGFHTDEVLMEELGLTRKRLAELRALNAI